MSRPYDAQKTWDSQMKIQGAQFQRGNFITEVFVANSKPKVTETAVLNARDQLGKLVPEILNHFDDVTAILQELYETAYEIGVDEGYAELHKPL